uniref:Uncharacterized protein n=1 Tax=Anguilla anguilla TaxID=7936 RepID=A0A0E9UCT7_ANGAN
MVYMWLAQPSGSYRSNKVTKLTYKLNLERFCLTMKSELYVSKAAFSLIFIRSSNGTW